MLFTVWILRGIRDYNDIWNVDSILQTPLQRLEARHPSVVHSGLASPDSGYDRPGWRGDEGARTTMELGTGDQLAAFHRRPAILKHC